MKVTMSKAINYNNSNEKFFTLIPNIELIPNSDFKNDLLLKENGIETKKEILFGFEWLTFAFYFNVVLN